MSFDYSDAEATWKADHISSVDKRCPKCGSMVLPDAHFCEVCGASLKEEHTPVEKPKPACRICPNCGSAIEDDCIFCNFCGMHLVSDPLPPEKEESGSSDKLIIKMTPAADSCSKKEGSNGQNGENNGLFKPAGDL